jgi:hypothetical protein
MIFLVERIWRQGHVHPSVVLDNLVRDVHLTPVQYWIVQYYIAPTVQCSTVEGVQTRLDQNKV